MTTKEKSIQIALGTYLPTVWTETCKLYAEGDKLCDESEKLCAEGQKLRAEGYKLYVKGDKLCAEGHKLFTDAVIEVYGKNIIDWKGYGCIVDGMEFRNDN